VTRPPAQAVVDIEFAAAETFLGPAQIAVPFQRVHREIQMRVEDEFGRSSC
jgi:hypothetical protein